MWLFCFFVGMLLTITDPSADADAITNGFTVEFMSKLVMKSSCFEITIELVKFGFHNLTCQSRLPVT